MGAYPGSFIERYSRSILGAVRSNEIRTAAQPGILTQVSGVMGVEVMISSISTIIMAPARHYSSIEISDSA